MKTMLLTSIAMTLLLASCAQKNSSNEVVKHQIIKGAFFDDPIPSSFNELELANLPRSVDLSGIMTSVKQQGDRGTCSFFTVAGIIESAVKKDLGFDSNISEEYLNYSIKTLGENEDAKNEGSYIATNISLIHLDGLYMEKDWPYQPSWFETGMPCEKYKGKEASAPALCVAHIRPTKDVRAKIIRPDGLEFYSIPKNTNAIIKFLATEQRPLTTTVVINDKGWPDSGETSYTSEMRDECLQNENLCITHTVILTGYDLDKKVFTFKNSWGKKWGKDGYGTIPFDIVDGFVEEDLFYAKVTNDFKIPKDYFPEEAEVESFEVQSSLADDFSLNVKLNSNIKNTNGRTVYVSSYLVKKSYEFDEEETNDHNTMLVDLPLELSPEGAPDKVKATRYYLPRENNNSLMELKAKKGAFFSIPAKTMTSPEIAGVMDSYEHQTMVRTTIYVITDEDGFKILKRLYTPIY